MSDVQDTFEVAIVGYGPVGCALAILLGQLGHRVVVLERWPSCYPQPRAVSFDHEVARVLQACGVGAGLGEITEQPGAYDSKTKKKERKSASKWAQRFGGLRGCLNIRHPMGV